jgi:hypothetical protein
MARRERLLFVGFLLCVGIAVVTVVLPELSSAGSDAAHKRPPAAAK